MFKHCWRRRQEKFVKNFTFAPPRVIRPLSPPPPPVKKQPAFAKIRQAVYARVPDVSK